MHTPLCRHATGEPVDYAAQAVRAGLTEIGFTDHSPLWRDDFDNWRMRLDQLDEYVEKVRLAQHEFPQLTIRLSLEVDYFPHREDWVKELGGRHPWDYLIGSVHYISDTWDIDNPEKISQWRNRPADEIWLAYFDRLTAAAASGLFEIIGHADLPKKFGFYPQNDLTGTFRRFLEAAKSTGTAIELNTAGLRKDCREIYPSRKILTLAHEFGVPITFGSDAHAPGEVGAAFDQAVALAREVGYRTSVRFAGREKSEIALPE